MSETGQALPLPRDEAPSAPSWKGLGRPAAYALVLGLLGGAGVGARPIRPRSDRLRVRRAARRPPTWRARGVPPGARRAPRPGGGGDGTPTRGRGARRTVGARLQGASRPVAPRDRARPTGEAVSGVRRPGAPWGPVLRALRRGAGQCVSILRRTDGGTRPVLRRMRPGAGSGDPSVLADARLKNAGRIDPSLFSR